jgi:uncharacterized protein YjbI with pentapeptide repeats
VANNSSDKLGGTAHRRIYAGWWSGLIALLFVILLLGSLFVFPQMLVDRTIASRKNYQSPSTADYLKAENDVRTTLLQGLGALVVLAGALTTWRQLLSSLDRNREEMRLNRAEFQLSQEGQVTERFTRAIEQLGNEKSLDVRLGGIYALERIAKDSPRDHGPIVEVLTAFVRERGRLRGDQLPAEGGQLPKTPADIQAILSVLGRRVIPREGKEPSLDLSQTDLRRADLRGAHLERALLIKANLEGADLTDAYLEEADLTEAHVEWADLTRAHLDGAVLTMAHLEANFLLAHLKEAVLNGAHLEKAVLTMAHLENAALTGAQLVRAILNGANLQGASITNANLEEANLIDAHLETANFGGANLKRASLNRTHLKGAFLRRANLEGADLTDAQLDRTDFWEARLEKSILRGIDLAGALNLTKEQIESAIT